MESSFPSFLAERRGGEYFLNSAFSNRGKNFCSFNRHSEKTEKKKSRDLGVDTRTLNNWRVVLEPGFSWVRVTFL
jgi:hypothetical protein